MATSFYYHERYNAIAAGRLLRETDLRIGKVRNASEMMPRDERGRSECHVYDRLRFQLWDAMQDLCMCNGHMHEHLVACNAEIKRCQINRDQVLHDLKKLHGSLPQSEYTKAVRDLTAEIATHKDVCERLRSKIQVAESVLASAGGKIGPGEKPRDRFSLPPVGSSVPPLPSLPPVTKPQPGPLGPLGGGNRGVGGTSLPPVFGPPYGRPIR